jgi:hypothetical protein
VQNLLNFNLLKGKYMELLNSKKTMMVAGAAATGAALLYYLLSATPCPPQGNCPPNFYQFQSGTKSYCLPCP